MKVTTNKGYMTFDYNQEFNIIVEIYGGILNYPDLIKLKKYQNKHSQFDPNLNGLVIITNVKINYSYDELLKFKEFLMQLNNYSGNRKTAILTDSPDQAALGLLYSKDRFNTPMLFNVFSTMNSCLKWIDTPPHLYKRTIDFVNDLMLITKVDDEI